MNALLKNAKDFLENIHPMPQNALTIHMPVIKSKLIKIQLITLSFRFLFSITYTSHVFYSWMGLTTLKLMQRH
jgi:hypothetical protein